MTDYGAAEAWDVIVTPWHLDEYIPAFPVPDGAAARQAITRLGRALGTDLTWREHTALTGA